MSGEDGPEAPSAPDAPGPQEPQDQQEPAEPAAEERAESRRPRLLPVWLLLGAAVLAGGAWAVTDRMGGGSSSPDETSVPLITASAEPWKVRPDDPGGMEIPNQGTLIYETLTTADPEEAPERILPPPEEPMSPPSPEPDRAEELAVAASGAANEVATQQPGAGVVDRQAPPPIEEAAPAEPEVPEIAAIREEPLTEPEAPAEAQAPMELEAPAEPAPVQDAAPLEPEPLEIDGIPLPPPPKPGTLAAARIEESTLPALGEPAMTDAGPEVADDALPELEPETLALIEDLLEREAPSQPVLAEDPDPVPLPPYKPTRIAGAAPAERETAAAPRETASVQSDSRTWRYVQLGAANSRGPLEAHWENLRRRHQDVLIGLSPLIMPVDSGASGITYRLRAGPLSDQAAAQRVCGQLKARGLDCFVPRD